MQAPNRASARGYRNLAAIWCACALTAIGVIQGCATRPQSLDQAPKLESRSELLKRLGPPLQVEHKGDGQVWHYRHRYLNVFTLTRTTWQATYSIDADGKVCDVEIQESSSSRRLWPRTKLPDDFQDLR